MRTGVMARLVDALDNLINPATEEKQDEIIVAINNISGTTPFNYIQKETTATYTYFGFSSTSGWKIKRKTITTGLWQYADGLFTGIYATYESAWADRASITYNNT